MSENKYQARKAKPFRTEGGRAAKPVRPRQSARSASIGSNCAARQAGHNPLIIPTAEEAATPKTAESMLISRGKPMSAPIK